MEFKLQNCLRPYKHFEEFIDWIKNEDDEPDLDALRSKDVAEARHDPSIDLLCYDEQLYNIPSLLLTDTPLQPVKHMREETGISGCKSWYSITREVAGKTGVRLERLADRVHHPQPIVAYQDGLARLTDWENDLKDFANIEGQHVSEITKRTILKAMIPADVTRDLERDRSLKPWDGAWKFVLEQMPLRKAWKPASKRTRGPDDMDVDLAEEAKAEPGDENDCIPCDGDLDTLKGSSRPFQGYCSYCWTWGHMKKDCRKLDAAIAKGKGKDGGKKGDGKDNKGTGTDKGTGGWQAKGGWQTKGKGGKGDCTGKGSAGVMHNIDGGDMSGGSGGWDSYGNQWIFSLHDDEHEEDGEDIRSEVSAEDVLQEESLLEAVSESSFRTFADRQKAHFGEYTSLEDVVVPAGEPQEPNGFDLRVPPTWAEGGSWSTPSALSATASTSPSMSLSYYSGTTAHLGDEKIWESCPDNLGKDVADTDDEGELEMPSVHKLDAVSWERGVLRTGCTDTLSQVGGRQFV